MNQDEPIRNKVPNPEVWPRAQWSARCAAPRVQLGRSRFARRSDQHKGHCSPRSRVRSRRRSRRDGHKKYRPLHPLIFPTTPNEKRPRFIPWSLDTQLSATVNVKQDDQVDLSDRLLHELAIHVHISHDGLTSLRADYGSGEGQGHVRHTSRDGGWCCCRSRSGNGSGSRKGRRCGRDCRKGAAGRHPPHEHDDQRSTSDEWPPMTLPELTKSHRTPSCSRMSLAVSMRAASCSLVIRGFAMLNWSPPTVSNTQTGEDSSGRVWTRRALPSCTIARARHNMRMPPSQDRAGRPIGTRRRRVRVGAGSGSGRCQPAMVRSSSLPIQLITSEHAEKVTLGSGRWDKWCRNERFLSSFSYDSLRKCQKWYAFPMPFA